MRLALFAAVALVAMLPASAQQPGVAVPGAPAADPRVNQVIVYGDDTCPPSTDEEIVVCVRMRDEERYRIPPNLRENPNAPGNQSWVNRATELAYVGRSGTDSCSTAGGGGFTGCLAQILNQAREERRAAGDVNWTRMVEEARQDREARLRAATQEEEEAERNTSSPN